MKNDRLVIRASDEQRDWRERAALTQAAWFQSYAHIYTQQEMEDLFANKIGQAGSWLDRRSHHLPSFVAVIGDQIVGQIGLALLQNGNGEVTSLYVHPQWQGRGVGLRLWQTAVTIFRTHECRWMEVWTLEKAEQAVDFYRGRGCLPFERGVYGVGRHNEPVIGLRCPLKQNEGCNEQPPLD